MTDTPSRNYSLLSLVPQPSNVVSKGSYTPIGDTGIPPKQALERSIGDTGVKWGYKYPKMEWMYMQKDLVVIGYLLGRCLPNTYLVSTPLFIGISAMFR